MLTDADCAALYDVLNPWGRSDAWYLHQVMAAGSVLDVGCGTGTLLRRARDAGHPGRLAGVDPDRAALAVARRTSGVEWVEATAASIPWRGEFDLAVMTGHAVQFLVEDDDLRASLAAVARALAPGGAFVFETRNLAAREWESWTPQHPMEVVDPGGRPLHVVYDVPDVTGDTTGNVVTVTESYHEPGGTVLRTDRARLRFLTVEALDRFLREAGFVLQARHGGWAGEPVGDGPEIVTVVRVPPVPPPT